MDKMVLYVLLIVVVFLLGIVVGVTLLKTRWKRVPLEQAERAKPATERRVSGGEDD
jgi:hypothetical protein